MYIRVKESALKKSIRTLQLKKALRFKPKKEKPKTQLELSIYQSVQDLQFRLFEMGDNRLYALFDQIRKKWLTQELRKSQGDLPFKLDGRIYINPKTRKPLTNREWSKIEKDLKRALKWAFADTKEFLSKYSIALGKILNVLDTTDAINSSFSDLEAATKSTIKDNDFFLRNLYAFSEQNTATLIQGLEDQTLKRIKQSILQAQQEGMTSKQLEAKLFDEFAEVNKDWRMIAMTETTTNQNNAFLMTEIEKGKQTGAEHSFVKGISGGANVCSWCRGHVDGKVFVVLDSPPETGEEVTVDGETYIAIWPGKNNYGRKRADWWVASGSQHPHCNCSFVKYVLGFEKYYDQLEEKIRKESMDNVA